MSVSQASQQPTSQPVQIHPLAELREVLFELGMMRNRNLVLANENHNLRERINVLEAQQKQKEIAEQEDGE